MATLAPTTTFKATPPTALTCSTRQLLEAIGVLASNVTAPFRNANATGIYGATTINALQFPDNAQNQFFGSQVYIDCNNTVPGNIVIQGSYAGAGFTFTGNTPVPADGPFGAGVSVLTTLQLMECIAVLIRELQPPYPFYNQTGLFRNGGNQFQFPDTPYNLNVGANMNPWTDGVFIYIPLQIGWPISGI